MTDLSAPARPADADLEPGPRTRRPLLLWVLAAVVAALAAVALGGAAPEPAPAGLPDAGPLPGWGLPVLRLAQHASALVLVGALLTSLLARRPVRSGLVAAAAVALVLSSLAAVPLGLADVVGQPVGEALSVELLRFYVQEVPQGVGLVRCAAIAGVVAAVALLSTVRGAATPLLAPVLLGLSLLALVPPLLSGHAAGEADHRFAQATLVVHVVAAVLWTGGLAALALLRGTGDLPRAAARFSPLALVCAAAVVGSGTVSGWVRLDEPAQLLTSGYGALVLLKAVSVALLVLAGAAHRRRTLPSLAAGTPGAFRRLAAAEVAVMAVAFGLAVALSRTPLP